MSSWSLTRLGAQKREKRKKITEKRQKRKKKRRSPRTRCCRNRRTKEPSVWMFHKMRCIRVYTPFKFAANQKDAESLRGTNPIAHTIQDMMIAGRPALTKCAGLIRKELTMRSVLFRDSRLNTSNMS